MTTMTTLHEHDEDRRQQQRRNGEATPAKTFGIAMAVVSLAGCLFTAGYNWRSVAMLEEDRPNYVRKDVQGEQLQRLNDRVSDLSRQIDEMRQEIRGRRP
jgi:HAMP domain-containing protein